MSDRCDGTLTQVTAGTATVYDAARRTTVKVRAGRSYLAKARLFAGTQGRVSMAHGGCARRSARVARGDAADPPLRGARGRDVREGQGRRLPAPRDRRGGDDRRRGAGDARRGLPDLDLPLARPRARARHRPEAGDGRAVRQGDRRLGRARRLDAHVRRRAALHGRLRDRRRQPAARGRARALAATTAGPTRSPSASSATARPTRARSARR